jgi:ADP-ribosylglycohydrolase
LKPFLELDHVRGGVLGAFIADAHAMPVHWYYDRRARERDYGWVEEFLSPRNPHPDSILWRSSYQALNERGEILHDQAQYWGRKGVHYHQQLRAGENTLNLQLLLLLLKGVRNRGRYCPDEYLYDYRDFMLSPTSHSDTYVEECHRKFFTNYARGKKLRSCGMPDNHIAGLTGVVVLCVTGIDDLNVLRKTVQSHVGLTHQDRDVLRAADVFAQILWNVLRGMELREAIEAFGSDFFSRKNACRWLSSSDGQIIDSKYSPACYVDKAFPASLYLAWKYANDFSAGVISNTNVGGDNCHRGVVIGTLLGAANGMSNIPERWKRGLSLLSEILLLLPDDSKQQKVSSLV